MMKNVPVGLLLAAAVAVSTPLAAARAADAYTVMSHDGRFRTWSNMINAANLASDARVDGHYTIFAPVEESMSNIDPDLMTAIAPKAAERGADHSQIAFVVRSHVVADEVPVTRFTGKVTTLKSVNGKAIVVDATKSPVEINFAGSNGTLAGDPIITDNAVIYPILITSAHYVPQ
jgi:uncharacterized surface protein with fasciclin (FAS1) repeats